MFVWVRVFGSTNTCKYHQTLFRSHRMRNYPTHTRKRGRERQTPEFHLNVGSTITIFVKCKKRMVVVSSHFISFHSLIRLYMHIFTTVRESTGHFEIIFYVEKSLKISFCKTINMFVRQCPSQKKNLKTYYVQTDMCGWAQESENTVWLGAKNKHKEGFIEIMFITFMTVIAHIWICWSFVVHIICWCECHSILVWFLWCCWHRWLQ